MSPNTGTGNRLTSISYSLTGLLGYKNTNSEILMSKSVIKLLTFSVRSQKRLVNMAASNSQGIQYGSAWLQRKVNLRPCHRGCHLVTDEILKALPEIQQFSLGLCHIQILHTSASLALNENWDPDVRDDFEMMLNKIVPEGLPYKHSCEGPDDMPAHVKACFIGSSLTIPVTDGKLNLGNWQGIWLCEHRNRAGSRKVVVTVNGVTRTEMAGRS